MPAPVRSATMPEEPTPPDPASSSMGPNAWLVDEMHEQFLADPTSVSESWQDFFADYRRDAEPQAGPAVTAPVAAAAAPPAAPAPGATADPSPPAPEAPGDPIRGAAARIVANMEASLEVPTATSFRSVPA